MRKMLQGLVTVMALAAASSAFAGEPNAKGERSLSREIAGRVAGQPVNCIDARRSLSTEIMDKTAIVYRMPGNMMYVNRPVLGVNNLDQNAIVAVRNKILPLCANDFVGLYDRGGKGPFQPSGTVSMGQFVPYAPVQR